MAKKKQAAPQSIANRIVQYGTKPADQFQANPGNWRTHPQTQRTALAGVLESVGWAAPVIENIRTGHLVDGHERVWQALQAGNIDVPYVQVDVSENEERTLLTTLDPIGALADTDREKLSELIAEVRSDDARVQELIAGIAERENIVLADETGHVPLDDVPPEIDRAAELQKEWGTERGQVWTCGKHRVMCGDSTSAEDVATLMDGKKAEMVWTDPPYGVDYDGGMKRREKLDGDTSPSLYSAFLPIIRKFIHPHAAVYLFYADGDAAVTTAGYEVRNTLVWNKNQAQFGALSAQYKQKHEPFLYCHIKGRAPAWFGDTNEVTVWEVDRANKNEYHPTQKPIELAARALGNSTKATDVVLDPFLGSGTTLIAAEQTGRVCYGMEISPAYVAVTLQRYKDVTGNTPVLT